MQLKTIFNFVCAALLAFLQPVHSLLIPILWLVFFDIVTAMYLVRVVRKEPLTSRGFVKKLPQLVTFFIALCASLHADPFFVVFGIPQYQAAKLVLAFYGVYEVFSILENLGGMGLPIAKQLMAVLAFRLPKTLTKKTETKDDKL